MAIQFDEDNSKETGNILRSLYTYIEVEKDDESEIYKVYMAKFNESLTLLKMTEPDSWYP